MARRAARVDANQTEIVAALRKVGARVAITSALGGGFPDVLACLHGRIYMLEIKDGNKPSSERKLTPAEQRFHDEWAGMVCTVENVTGALIAIGATGVVY